MYRALKLSTNATATYMGGVDKERVIVIGYGTKISRYYDT